MVEALVDEYEGVKQLPKIPRPVRQQLPWCAHCYFTRCVVDGKQVIAHDQFCPISITIVALKDTGCTERLQDERTQQHNLWNAEVLCRLYVMRSRR